MTVPQSFVGPRQVLAGLDERRFRQLEQAAALLGGLVEWGERLAYLSYTPEEVARAMEQPLHAPDDGTWPGLFDPFEGLWVGGDLHDASRSYQHIWYPARRDDDLVAQPVVMVATGARLQVARAYNFARRVDDGVQIRGVVGERLHVGYRLGRGGLAWAGEEPDGQISLHVERVWARGQLYDIRGAVVARDDPTRRPDHISRTILSDWRYHRVDDGAIEVPRGEPRRGADGG